MKVATALIITFFWVILFVDCILILNQYNEYRVYTKPLLVPLLYILMAVQTVNTTHRRSKFFIGIALLGCFAGDLFLLKGDQYSYFVAGLTSFLVAHIFFSIFFYRLKPFTRKRTAFIVIISCLTVGYFVLFLTAMWTKIQDQNLALPIMIYSPVIGFMALTAIYTITGRRVRRLAMRNFIPGAILFVISDSLLAISKLYSAFLKDDIMLLLNILVMVTYGLAVFLIVTGATRFIKR